MYDQMAYFSVENKFVLKVVINMIFNYINLQILRKLLKS